MKQVVRERGANWCNSGVTQHQLEQLVPNLKIFQHQDQDESDEVEMVQDEMF